MEAYYQRQDSVTFGINRRSELNKINGFHVVSQLPPDIMHILFEGVLPMQIKLLLYNWIYIRKLVSLYVLNGRIKNFVYGLPEVKNKLSKDIEEKHIIGESKLPLSGVYNLLLNK